MKRLLLLTIFAAVATIIVVWVVVDRPEPPEPEYQGQPISAWLNRLTTINPDGDKDLSCATNNPNFIACQHALVAMGTNAISYLLDELQWQEPEMKKLVGKMAHDRAIREMLPNTWTRNLFLYSVSDGQQINFRHMRAACGFILLGTNGASAQSSLMQMTQNSNPMIRSWSFCAFESTRPSKKLYMPVVLRLLKDSDETVRILAGGELKEHYPEEIEPNKVYDLVPILRPAPTNQVSE